MRKRFSGIGQIHAWVSSHQMHLKIFESSAVYATAAITTVIDFSCATGERAALRNGVLRGSNIGMRANMIATASNNFLRRFGAK